MNRRSIFKSILGVIAGVPAAKAVTSASPGVISSLRITDRKRDFGQIEWVSYNKHQMDQFQSIQRNFEKTMLDCWEDRDVSLYHKSKL